MARTITNIQNAIIAALVTAAGAAGVTIVPAEWSMYDYRQLITYVVADAIATLEQLWDAFKTDVAALVAVAAPQTGPWFQAQMLKFQYDATTPQVVQLSPTTFAPYYPTVNTLFQIIKYCAVVPGAFGTTIIKVAKQTAGLPDALSSPELDAAQSYAEIISVPGITVSVASGASDKIYIAATVYHDGLYSPVIGTTVPAAIKAYLQIQTTDNPNGIPFNGVFTLSDLEVAIKAVPGVTDVVFTNVRGRADGTAYPGGTVLVVGTDGAVPTGNVIARNYALAAGYCETETTATHEITDSITYIPN